MKSSTEWVCDVCDSQLLPASSSGRFKNNLSRWMRTSEVEGWRSVADLELDTRLGMLWLSHLWNVMGKCKSLANTQLSACKTNDENDFESNLNTMQEKGEAGPKLISLRNMRKAVTTCVAGFKCWFFAQVFWLGHCHIRKCSSHPRTPRCSCESSGFHWVRTNSYNRLQHMNCHSSQRRKLALYSSLPCETSKLSLGTLGMEGGNKQREGDFETLIFRQAYWSSHPVWTKSWLWNAS